MSYSLETDGKIHFFLLLLKGINGRYKRKKGCFADSFVDFYFFLSILEVLD